ncbi:MAG: hypothetical protein ACE5J3_07840 [Methanosarcinales archaeon]
MKPKLEKVDFEKVNEVEKNPERVEEVVSKWAYKYRDTPDLTWDEAMSGAAKELGLNKIELYTLLYGNEPFKELALGISMIRNLKRLEVEGEELMRRLFGDKKVVRCVSRQ